MRNATGFPFIAPRPRLSRSQVAALGATVVCAMYGHDGAREAMSPQES